MLSQPSLITEKNDGSFLGSESSSRKLLAGELIKPGQDIDFEKPNIKPSQDIDFEKPSVKPDKLPIDFVARPAVEPDHRADDIFKVVTAFEPQVDLYRPTIPVRREFLDI